jgi:hypothetical protein
LKEWSIERSTDLVYHLWNASIRIVNILNTPELELGNSWSFLAKLILEKPLGMR